MLTQIPKGTVVDGRYEILELIGGGGMGSVFKARELGLGRIVAIKFVHDTQLATSDGIARFEREGRIMSELAHRNIALLFRFAIWNETPYIAMEFVPGKSLREQLDEDKRLSPQDVIVLGIQLADALHQAHSKGVIHRDLKPQNIILVDGDEPGLVKIIDFGLARIVGGKDGEQQRLTQTGTLIGSVQYMSPEQCLGGKADAGSDMYSLACVLYECLTGEPPLVADNPVGMLHLHVNEIPKPLSTYGLKLPRGLEDVIFKALEKKPANRYSSMEEFKADLIRVSQGRSPELIASPSRQGRAKAAFETRTLFLVGSLLVLAAGLSVWFNDTWLYLTVDRIIDLTSPAQMPAIKKLDLSEYLLENGRPKVADDLAADLAPTRSQLSTRTETLLTRDLMSDQSRDAIDQTIQTARAYFLRGRIANREHKDAASKYILGFQYLAIASRTSLSRKQIQSGADLLAKTIEVLKQEPLPRLSKDREACLDEAAIGTVSRLEQHAPAASEDLLKWLLARRPNYDEQAAAIYVALARIASDSDRHEEGLKYLSMVEKSGSRHHVRYAYFLMSRTYSKLSNWSKALECAEKAFKDDGAHGDNLAFYASQVAGLQLKLGRASDAEATMVTARHQAMRIPDLLESSKYLPWCLIAQGRVREAREALEALINTCEVVRKQDDPRLMRMLQIELFPLIGYTSYVLDEPDQGLKYLHESAALRQDNFTTFNISSLIAACYIKKGDLEKAKQWIKESSGPDPQCQTLLAIVQGKTDQARHSAKLLAKAQPAIYELLLAQIDIKEDRPEDARSHLEKALNLSSPDNIYWLEATDLYVNKLPKLSNSQKQRQVLSRSQ